TGVLFLILRGPGPSSPGCSWQYGEPGDGGKSRSGLGLKGLVFSGSRPEVVYRDRPLSAWVQELKERRRRGRAVRALLSRMEDREHLVQGGRAVKTAQNVKEARRMLHGSLPDLLILDLALPDGDDLEALQALGARNGIEVVMIDSNGTIDY